MELVPVFEQFRYICMLKARQVGFTWFALFWACYVMESQPGSTILLFSRRDDEAVEMLDVRLKGIHQRLPDWLRSAAGRKDRQHQWSLANGSRALALPTTGGASYTATVAIIDEADKVPDLERLLSNVEPTMSAHGQLILLSTPDKSLPESLFKKIYLGGKAGENQYKSVFHGWRARPERTEEWYQTQKKTSLADTGSLDYLQESYPETDAEALAPRSLDKRIPSTWLALCFRELKPIDVTTPSYDAPAIPGLVVFACPIKGKEYVIGMDPAEGNPTSDDSALCVLDHETGEQVATLASKIEPQVLADYADKIGKWYNHANLMCERNNHGHAVLLWLNEHSGLTILEGHDEKPGWLSSSLGKAQLYDACAEMVRHGEVTIHALSSFVQLCSIDGNTLRAPEGQHDDKADAFALACVARLKSRYGCEIHSPASGKRNEMQRLPRGVF